MLGLAFHSISRSITALPNETPLNEAQRARVATRLQDMRQTLGDEDFETLINQTLLELRALSEHAPPWPAALAQRGLNVAMLLGFDALEIACRAIVDQSPEDVSDRAAEAAQAALVTLNDLI